MKIKQTRNWKKFGVYFPYIAIGTFGIIGYIFFSISLGQLNALLPQHPEYIQTLCPVCADYTAEIARIGVIFLVLSCASVLVGLFFLVKTRASLLRK